jgi:hypothetical protein
LSGWEVQIEVQPSRLSTDIAHMIPEKLLEEGGFTHSVHVPERKEEEEEG